MRLASFGVKSPVGTLTRLGLVVDTDELLDVNAAFAELLARQSDTGKARAIADAVTPPDMLDFLDNGALGLQALDKLHAAEFDGEHNRFGQRLKYRHDEIALLAPLPRPHSIRDCSAFEEHVRNAAGPRGVPGQWYRHPTYYKGNPSSVVGTGVPVRRPVGETRLDYELEFAVVIGTPGRDISIDAAPGHVAGYTVFNDVSCRDIQLAEMRAFLGPAKGKDFDGGNVLGPYLVTPDEFDPSAANTMIARVDGVEWSRGQTDTLHYSVPEIINYISRSETLFAGDVIGVGTVGGGCGLELGRYPEMNQEVELEVAGLGVLRNRFIDAEVLLDDAAKRMGRETSWDDSKAKSR